LVSVPIAPDRKKLLLSRVAYRAFDRDITFFKKDNLRDLIEAELNYLDLSNISPDKLLREIESHNGLLIEYAPEVYRFSHLTFHEFFTALYYHDTKEYPELFHKAVREPRYMEVFLMCVEKMYNADQMMMNLISYIKNQCFTKTADNPIYHRYEHSLVNSVLHCDIAMNHKLRAVLEEMNIRLEQMSINDQSVSYIDDRS